jgi:hypothetical protein
MAHQAKVADVQLRMQGAGGDVAGELSACCFGPDGALWLASDEVNELFRLTLVAAGAFGAASATNVADLLALDGDDEIDIEGLDTDGGCLWLTGSHSGRRRKPKGDDPGENIKRIAKIRRDANRFLIARIPFAGGTLAREAPVASAAGGKASRVAAAALMRTPSGNILTDALGADPHISPFLQLPLAAKENGFDIEGLAVHGDRVFVGLRGPVVGGYAIVLDIEVTDQAPGELGLAPVASGGRLYRKHFLGLDGLGIRDLCFNGADLLILAGPTMDADGPLRVYQLDNALALTTDGFLEQSAGRLRQVLALPCVSGGDKAEGLTLMPQAGEGGDGPSLLVVFDAPSQPRWDR